MKNELQTISWDNSNIYQNFQDPQITQDLKKIETGISYLQTKITFFESLVPTLASKKTAELEETIPLARECYRLLLDTKISIHTLHVFASTAASVNALNYDAKDLSNKALQLYADLNKAAKPLDLFLLRAPQAYLDTFLKHDSVAEVAFALNYAKKEEKFLLGVAEEVLLEGHGIDGFHAWGNLYKEISGAMKVEVEGELMGLASASNILFGADAPKRKTAYKSINEAWDKNSISAAAVLLRIAVQDLAPVSA